MTMNRHGEYFSPAISSKSSSHLKRSAKTDPRKKESRKQPHSTGTPSTTTTTTSTSSHVSHAKTNINSPNINYNHNQGSIHSLKLAYTTKKTPGDVQLGENYRRLFTDYKPILKNKQRGRMIDDRNDRHAMGIYGSGGGNGLVGSREDRMASVPVNLPTISKVNPSAANYESYYSRFKEIKREEPKPQVGREDHIGDGKLLHRAHREFGPRNYQLDVVLRGGFVEILALDSVNPQLRLQIRYPEIQFDRIFKYHGSNLSNLVHAVQIVDGLMSIRDQDIACTLSDDELETSRATAKTVITTTSNTNQGIDLNTSTGIADKIYQVDEEGVFEYHVLKL
eukprot:CAMPEP_0115009856 /NCGR_PEP_ID=MMETSP0216-20121206/22915_1 /TAXON_ID=223996 /ORGANISM="Protocruzia adherens, Strain Boccale" /LENGTH=336 /DNA_ID=CAMNT_0002377851 /DNA_START=486 /DNA_END=1496 /DNA_ORIENTATION=+